MTSMERTGAYLHAVMRGHRLRALWHMWMWGIEERKRKRQS